MDTKAKLVELLKNLPQVNHFEAQVQGMDYVFRCAADHLIANGVTIPVRCKDCTFLDTEGCPMKGIAWDVQFNDFCSCGERRTDD